MNTKLPPPRFFTYAELAERWSCTVDHIAHLIDINELPAADKYAAMNGRRSTVFVPAEPAFMNKEERRFYEAIRAVADDSLHEADKTDGTLIVEVPIPHTAIHNQDKWDACFVAAQDALPASRIPVVLAEHVLQFEGRNQTTPYQKPSASPWVPRAAELGKQFKKDNPRHSQDQISAKVAKQLEKEGITGRGGRTISAPTVKREALKGVK